MKTFRDQAGADQSCMDMITARWPGIDGRQPIAAFTSAPFTMNSGAGIVDCLVVQMVLVHAPNVCASWS